MPLSASLASLTELLNALPSLAAHTKKVDTALGAGLDACHQLLEGTGGRLVVLQHVLPSTPNGAQTHLLLTHTPDHPSILRQPCRRWSWLNGTTCAFTAPTRNVGFLPQTTSAGSRSPRNWRLPTSASRRFTSRFPRLSTLPAKQSSCGAQVGNCTCTKTAFPSKQTYGAPSCRPSCRGICVAHLGTLRPARPAAAFLRRSALTCRAVVVGTRA